MKHFDGLVLPMVDKVRGQPLDTSATRSLSPSMASTSAVRHRQPGPATPEHPTSSFLWGRRLQPHALVGFADPGPHGGLGPSW